MRGDVTRRTFRSGNHYRGVLQQQGRVQLDADWNEQVELQAYLDRTVTSDVVGLSGAPRDRAGMGITKKDGTPLPPTPVAAARLWIKEGHYYVDGILCENDETVQLEAQPDLPGVKLDGKTAGTYVAYLDVWCEDVTALDRPELREVALGGPDTATRARTIWQVRLRRKDGPEDDPKAARKELPRMTATVVAPTAASSAPCVVGPAARFRGLENQLYRVEVFDPSPQPTFVYSRENGSVVAALKDLKAEPSQAGEPEVVVLTIAAPGLDDRLAFHPDDWVEVTDRGRVLRGEAGHLGRVTAVEGAQLTVVFANGRAPAKISDFPDHPVVRRWDSVKDVAQPQPIPNDASPVGVEDGIQVAFGKDGVYRTGDYWLVPARTANLDGDPVDPDLAGNIEWPPDGVGADPFAKPAGVIHHYADIAELELTPDGWRLVADLRRIFAPLTDQLDVTAAGGDGQEAMPGDPLPQPLRVAVTRGLSPVVGAKVRFTVAEGNGELTAVDGDGEKAAADGTPGGAAADVVVETGADGVAQCQWKPAADTSRPSQRVTARLLGPDGEATGPALGFAASLSVADRVWFNPADCAVMADAKTVDAALRRLAEAPVLTPGASQGQTGAPGEDLAAPVGVRVLGCGKALPGAQVRFDVGEGAVAPVGGNPDPQHPGWVVVDSDANGVAQCRWRLGDTRPVQTLTAAVLDKGAPDGRTAPLVLVAGVAFRELRVERVEMPRGTILDDGAMIAAADLATSPAAETVVVLTGEPAKTVAGSPALTVTLDLPFPFSAADQAVWPFAVAGSLPMTLDGEVKTIDGSRVVIWTPSPAAARFVKVLHATMRARGRGEKVRGHVRLAGSVLGPGAADATRWFWLVEKLTHLVLVPHRDGRLRLPSAQRAIALSVERAALTAGLPAGVTAAEGAQDLEEARRARRRIFTRAAPERALRLVVDSPYAAAAEAVKAALSAVDVETEILPAAEPATATADRLAAGETIDGVLTDAASVDALLEVDGFLPAVPL